MTPKEKQLTVELLIERIERLSGKKVVFSEAKEYKFKTQIVSLDNGAIYSELFSTQEEAVKFGESATDKLKKALPKAFWKYIVLNETGEAVANGPSEKEELPKEEETAEEKVEVADREAEEKEATAEEEAMEEPNKEKPDETEKEKSDEEQEGLDEKEVENFETVEESKKPEVKKIKESSKSREVKKSAAFEKAKKLVEAIEKLSGKKVVFQSIKEEKEEIDELFGFGASDRKKNLEADYKKKISVWSRKGYSALTPEEYTVELKKAETDGFEGAWGVDKAKKVVYRNAKDVKWAAAGGHSFGSGE